LHDLRALREPWEVGGDQGGVVMAATGQAPCPGEVAAERVDRDVAEAGQTGGQVLVGGERGTFSALLGDDRLAVDGEVDGAAQPRVGERPSRC
jgi:hypothetical protein